MTEPTTIAQPTDPHDNPNLDIETFRMAGDGTAYYHDYDDNGSRIECPPPARASRVTGTVRSFGDMPTDISTR